MPEQTRNALGRLDPKVRAEVNALMLGPENRSLLGAFNRTRNSLLSHNIVPQSGSPLDKQFSIGDMAMMAAEFAPGVGDVISAADAVEFAKQGKPGWAALSGLGALPLIPSVGGMIKPAAGGAKMAGETPKVVYHGTALFPGEAREKFSTAALGRFTDVDPGAKSGFFFAEAAGDADMYAERAASRAKFDSYGNDASPYIGKYSIKANKPLVLDANNSAGIPPAVFNEIADNNAAAIEYAKRNGFDSVYIKDGDQMNTPGTWVVFSPDQIEFVGDVTKRPEAVKPINYGDDWSDDYMSDADFSFDIGPDGLPR